MTFNLTKKQFLTFVFKSQICFVYFLSETYLGFAIYMFCLVFSVAGKNQADHSLFYYVCLLFTFFSLIIVFINYLFMKISFLRQFISNYVSNEFIINYLGAFSGTQAAIKLGAGTLCTVFAEVVTQKISSWDAQERATKILEEGRKGCGSKSLDRCASNIEAMKKANAMLSEPQKGIVEKGFQHMARTEAVKQAAETVRETLGRGR